MDSLSHIHTERVERPLSTHLDGGKESGEKKECVNSSAAVAAVWMMMMVMKKKRKSSFVDSTKESLMEWGDRECGDKEMIRLNKL